MTVNKLIQFIKDISEYKEFDGRFGCQEHFAAVQNKLLKQQAEIKTLKRKLLGSVMETVYAERTVEVISDYLEKRQIEAKTLTDEEIIVCIDESEPDTADMIRFARAILRKAQEK
jgi:hypothetical protein